MHPHRAPLCWDGRKVSVLSSRRLVFQYQSSRSSKRIVEKPLLFLMGVGTSLRESGRGFGSWKPVHCSCTIRERRKVIYPSWLTPKAITVSSLRESISPAIMSASVYPSKWPFHYQHTLEVALRYPRIQSTSMLPESDLLTLHSCPMLFSGVREKATDHSNCMSNVWPCAHHSIH